MFKNLNLYRIAPGWAPSLEEMEDALEAGIFAHCGATQDKSAGWIEPRGETNGALVESVVGQRILRLRIETKSVPGATVRAKAQAEADHIEATTGRKPGKKETRQLREDALLSLLPRAFPKHADVWVWIDLQARLLVTDAASQGKTDEVVTALVRAFDGLVLTQVQTATSPQAAMTQWLSSVDIDGWPKDFSIERACELRSGDEERSVVKFNRHNLTNDEIRKHITEGKLPTRMAMSWEGRVSFTLHDSMRLSGVELLDVALEDLADDSGFDCDVALITGELQKLIPALIDAMGGELVFGTK